MDESTLARILVVAVVTAVIIFAKRGSKRSDKR